MKNSWIKTELGEHIETLKGFAFKSKWYEKTGVAVVRVTDFTENSISTKALNYISDEIASSYCRYEIYHHDVIVQTVGSWQSNPASVVGKVIHVPYNMNGALLNQNAVKITPKASINQRFLYYLLKANNFRQHNLNYAQGAANQASITLDTIRRFKLNLPPLITQQKIANILSAYDDLIENNAKRIELLEEQAQLLYEEWFVRMKFPDYENTLIDEESGLPEGWEVTTIEKLSEVKGGKRLPKGHDLTSEKTSYPYIRVRDLTSGRINIDDIHFINHDTHIKIKNYIINHTDLYISIAGTVGLVGMVPKILDAANLTENCAKITNFISEDIKEYLNYFLNSENGQHHISSRTGGASQPKLALERIRSIPITVPNDEVLSCFHNSVSVINEFVENLLIQNQKLKEARDILLPRLMMGVIKV